MRNKIKNKINKIVKSEIFMAYFGMFMLGLCYICGFSIFGGISVNELFTLLGYVVLAAMIFGSFYSLAILLFLQFLTKQQRKN